jgi:hypothetical protein
MATTATSAVPPARRLREDVVVFVDFIVITPLSMGGKTS